MTPAEFAKERSQLIRSLKKVIAPLLAPSGYIRRTNKGVKSPLKLWVPKDRKGEPTLKAYKLLKGFVVQDFLGFTEEGVITDMYGGGLVTAYWEGIPFEDLFRLQNWANRMLPKLTANDKKRKTKATK